MTLVTFLIANYDSPRRTSGKTIILYNNGDVIMFKIDRVEIH